MSEQTFRFGGPTPATATNCCGKPVGCTQTQAGCGFLKHPWKRAVVFGDPDAPCAKRWMPPGSERSVGCALTNGHDGACVPAMVGHLGRS